jgi:signal transduction histidine kinase
VSTSWPRAGNLPLAAVVVLILAPGLALGYFGFRTLAEREQSLRTNYNATTVLVRDRLAAELARLESSVPFATVQSELAVLESDQEWLEAPFILRVDGSVTMSGLHAGVLPHPSVVLASAAAAASLVNDAEHEEFVDNDLHTALALYRRALSAVPQTNVATRAFVLTRVGRTLFKLGHFAEGVSAYGIVESIARDAVDANGFPLAVIAMLQIIDGHAALHRPDDVAAAEQQLAGYVLEHPWDLDNGYVQYLTRVMAYMPRGDDRGRATAAAMLRQAAELQWVRAEVYPRLSQELIRDAPGSSAVRHTVVPGDRPVLLSYRVHVAGSPPVPTVFAFRVRLDYVGGPLLAQVLDTVDLGNELLVSLTTHDGSSAGPAATSPLATAELLTALPLWQVALLDKRGRSIPQLVARERWTYGALIAGVLTVMSVGVALTLRASAQAAALAQARSDFVSNVSHELKTPLALIRMFGETLESGIVADPAKRQEFYGIIRRESERLTQLIDNVLDLNRIDRGTKRYEIRAHDLVETTRAALDAYRPMFDRMGFTVETAFPDSPLTVSIDRDAVVQSLVNLFQNVIKYSGTSRFVAVAVRYGQGGASVSVADRGLGIAADQIDRIFERYYRVPHTAAAVPAGSGLGLALVKHTIDAHGGRVDVQSSPGAGSTFTLVLPVAGPVAPALPLPIHSSQVGA